MQRLAFDRIVRVWELELLALAMEHEHDVFFGSVRIPEELLAKKATTSPTGT